jgi:hypothetical protein
MIRIVAILAVLAAPIMAAPGDAFNVPADADHLLDRYCYSCHDDETQKGDVQLDNLSDLKLGDRLDLLNRVQEQLYIGEMPPKKKKQPTDGDHDQLMVWLTKELRQHNAAKLEEKLLRYEYGNYVDHDKLFSGEHIDLPGATPDRRWMISEFIFNSRVNRIVEHRANLTIDGKRHAVRGAAIKERKITNPFLLPPKTGVRYYANTSLDGGHLLTMLANAQEMAQLMTTWLGKRNKNYLPAYTKIMALETQHTQVLDRRENFLNTFVETVLIELYGDEHETLLAAFVPVNGKASLPTDPNIKKAPFHAANPGNNELALIFRSMRRLETEGDTDEQLIAKCEREWFHHGHNARTIQTRVTFLHGYMEEFRKQVIQHKFEQKHKPYVYKPLSDDEMKVVTATIQKHRAKSDRYNAVIAKCMAQWRAEFEQERVAAGPPSDETTDELVGQLFVKILEREPTAAEAEKYGTLTRRYITELGNLAGVQKMIQTLILNTDFVYRQEFGGGDPDAHGRKMLSPRDASYAIALALTDDSPDKELAQAAAEGRLNTRKDYEREVKRMLARRDQFSIVQHIPVSRRSITSVTDMPAREIRFFREFFGYPQMLTIFKDRKRFGGDYDGVKARLVVEADQLVGHILEEDQNVFEKLLTTDEFYVFHNSDNTAMQAATDRIAKIHDYFKDKDWENFTVEDLAEHKAFLAEVKIRGIDVNRLAKDRRYDPLRNFKTVMTSFGMRRTNGNGAAPYVSFPAHGPGNAATRLGRSMDGPQVAKFFNIDMSDWDYQGQQPAKRPNRKGMLTHPAWLIAHAGNTETDPVKRGKWVREKLLAGTVPDVPITVDAVIPEDHHKTLRDRLVGATEKQACWKCHERMNPLGYAFEIYDDFGRFRTLEALEHPDNLLKKGPDKAEQHVDLRDTYKTLSVNAAGTLDGTGDAKLDGEVKDAIDMSARLAQSARVRQSIIRHAFRYFLGRNETLSDSKTLIDADKAYVDSGGSFDAVIVSLLTSDSFIYRK